MAGSALSAGRCDWDDIEDSRSSFLLLFKIREGGESEGGEGGQWWRGDPRWVDDGKR